MDRVDAMNEEELGGEVEGRERCRGGREGFIIVVCGPFSCAILLDYSWIMNRHNLPRLQRPRGD